MLYGGVSTNVAWNQRKCPYLAARTNETDAAHQPQHLRECEGSPSSGGAEGCRSGGLRDRRSHTEGPSPLPRRRRLEIAHVRKISRDRRVVLRLLPLPLQDLRALLLVSSGQFAAGSRDAYLDGGGLRGSNRGPGFDYRGRDFCAETLDGL